jgi:fucose permease
MAYMISEKRMVERDTRLLLVMFAAYFTFGLVLNVVGVMIPVVINQYHLSLFVGGLLASALYLPFGVCSIPAGIAADRFGLKPVVVLGVALMAVGCALIPLAHDFVPILLGAFVVGSGIAFLQTAGNPLILRVDRPENYHRNLTLTIGFCGIGAFVGPICLSILQAHHQPWQRLYDGYVVLCSVLVFLFAVRRFPGSEVRAKVEVSPRVVLKLLRNPVAITYILGIFFYVGAEVGTASWIVKFFQQVHGLGIATTNYSGSHSFLSRLPALPILCVSFFWGLQGVGRLTSGPGIHKFGARKLLRWYALGATCCLLLAIFGSVPVTAMGFAVCGFFTSVLFTLIFSGAVNTFPEHQGTLSGMLVTASIGGALIPPLVGLTADHFGIHTAMFVPLLCFIYVLAIAMLGRAKYE